MPTEGAPTNCVIRQNPAPINRPVPVSWIPAFAGMTEEAGHYFMQALPLLAKQYHAARPHRPGGNAPVASSLKLP